LVNDPPSPSQADVAEYIREMVAELSEIAEAARLDSLATILYAAQLEAKRARDRLDKTARKTTLNPQ
jgi:outer membrane murein-binding lipoprotein Lpp